MLEQPCCYRCGDLVALRTARANRNCTIGVAKLAENQKVQDFFQDPGNTRGMWKRIHSITDYKAAPLPCDNDIGFLNNIKDYFGRFETTNSIPAKKSTTSPSTSQSDYSSEENPQESELKAAGTDKIPGQVLKECDDQLARVLTDIFNTLLDQASQHNSDNETPHIKNDIIIVNAHPLHHNVESRSNSFSS